MQPNSKILIIDDDPKNIFALVATLRAKGFDPLSAQNVIDGLELVQKEPVGIILLDMMMPEIDGYQALPMIRDLDASNQMPVIAVTAQAMKGDREKCLQAGATDYISKPIDVDLLVSKLHNYLQRN